MGIGLSHYVMILFLTVPFQYRYVVPIWIFRIIYIVFALSLFHFFKNYRWLTKKVTTLTKEEK